jgi:hypothetical protein
MAFLRLYSPFVSLLDVGVPLPADFAQNIHFRLVRSGLLLQNIVSKWLIDKLLKINYLRCSLFSRLFGVLTLFYRVGWVVSATLASGVLVGK